MKPPPEWRLPGPADDPPAGFSPVEWRILRARGAEDEDGAARLLDAASGPEHDPFLLEGVSAAVARIREAIRLGEEVVVYGDYDADGLTASALLVGELERLGAKARAFIPSRFEEGYGLQASALVRLKEEGAALVVSVDCGVRAVEEVRVAREAGLDVVVTDHHEPGSDLPPAVSVVNPKQPGDRYPFKGLAGVGLAYKLASALRSGEAPSPESAALLAVGTIADLAPLVDENRALVARGLDGLRRSPPTGLGALMDGAGIRRGRLTARDVAFGLGPRLNAAGRLGSAWTAYRLLTADDRVEAMRLAGELDRANRDRQDQTKALLEDVQTRLEALDEVGALIFAADAAYGEGLLGPAASKLVEDWHRPAVLVSLREGEARGSARSVKGFHITRALEACAPLLSRFGGHEAAAGFSLDAGLVGELAERLQDLARAGLPSVPPPEVDVDVLVTPEEVDGGLMDFLDRMEPFGTGFPAPLLACLGMTLMDSKPVGRDRAHLRLLLRHPRGAREAIAFRQGRRRPRKGTPVDVAFYAERDAYLGVESIRWNVQSLRPSPTAALNPRSDT